MVRNALKMIPLRCTEMDAWKVKGSISRNPTQHIYNTYLNDISHKNLAKVLKTEKIIISQVFVRSFKYV